MKSFINDIRIIKDFNGLSFSKFKKSKVKDELIKSIYFCNIEQAMYWCAELIGAGHFLDIWDIIFQHISKNIHIGNPKLSIYISLRIDNFKDIICQEQYVNNELELRNNELIRIIFCEIILILCFSKKKTSIEFLKIKNDNEFNIVNISDKLQAPSTIFINDIYKEGDPKSLYIAINELSYTISIKDTINSYYWVEWILRYEILSKKKKKNINCVEREYPNVQNKYKKNVIWLIWDVILYYSILKSKIINIVIESLLKMFCLKYISSYNKKRKSIIYFTILLLTEDNINFNLDIINNKNKINTIIENIDNTFNELKKNQIDIDTLNHDDNLNKFDNNIHKKKYNKIIEKLSLMNKNDIFNV